MLGATSLEFINLKKISLVFLFSFFTTVKVNAQLNNEDQTEFLNLNSVFNFMQFESHYNFQYWVKFIVFLDQNGELKNLVFQNSNKFKFHADFLILRPEFKGLNKNQINQLTTLKNNRRAFVGTLFLGDLDHQIESAFEVIADESLEVSQIQKLQKKIKEASSELTAKLAYAPLPQFRDLAKANSKVYSENGILLWFPFEASTKSVCYANGNTFGRVKIIRESDYAEKLKNGLITANDILILDRLPRDIVPVAAVIVAEESSPSSHAALLGQMMGFPVVYQNQALADWQKWDGQFVMLAAKGSYNWCVLKKIKVTDPSTIEKLIQQKRPYLENIKPMLDESLQHVIDLQKINFTDVARVGGKAANMSRLIKVLPTQNVPMAVVIPVSFYRRYLREAQTKNGMVLGDYLQQKLQEIQSLSTPTKQVLATIKDIRENLKNTEIPLAILTEIQNSLSKSFPNSKMRLKFRSSSNVEDLKSFNGAGLYDSKGVCPADTDENASSSFCDPTEKPDTIVKGLHKVWSSLYNDRAYLARRYLQIDESSLAMAILVQPSYRGELANGVAILDKDEYTGEFRLTVTGFPGEDLEVVHPPAGKIPETSQVSLNWEKQVTYQILVPSTELPQSRQLLQDDQYKNLFELASQVAKTWQGSDFTALDFEWKLIEAHGHDQIVIKQVREVPTGIKKNENRTNDIIWVLRQENHFGSYFGESDFGLAAMKGNVSIEISAPYFSLNDLKKGISHIESIKLTTIDGEFYFKGSDIKFEVQTTPWETVQRFQGQSPIERRTNKIRFYLPNPVVPHLLLNFEVAEVKGDPQIAKIQTRIFSSSGHDNWATESLHFVTQAKDFLDVEDRFINGDEYFWSAHDNFDFEKVPENPPHEYNTSFSSSKIRVDFKATTTMGGFDKTMFLKIAEAQISGLLSKPILVRNEKALVYAPAHHNFGWEYVVDLSRLEDATGELLAEIKNLKARYLLISSVRGGVIQASLWSDLECVKDLGPIEMIQKIQ